MHEFHVMTQVVKTVEAQLHGTTGARPVVVRLKIGVLSHLLAQDPSVLHTAFALAAQGTKAEGAKLEIIPVSGEAWCSQCQMAVVVSGPEGSCSTCGGPMLAGQSEPEVLVHEVVVEE